MWCIQMKWWGHWAQKETLLTGRRWEAWSPALEEAMRAIEGLAHGLFQLDLKDGVGPRRRSSVGMEICGCGG